MKNLIFISLFVFALMGAKVYAGNSFLEKIENTFIESFDLMNNPSNKTTDENQSQSIPVEMIDFNNCVDAVEEAVEAEAEKEESEQGNLQHTEQKYADGTYTIKTRYGYGLHIDAKGVKERVIDWNQLPGGFKVKLHKCPNGWYSIGRGWTQDGVPRYMYVNPTSPLSMHGAEHCNFKMYHDTSNGFNFMMASDGRKLNFGNLRPDYYGPNDDAYDMILDSKHFDPIGLKKW